jgi:asparagine synthase (glutamine-hydrolysing)
MAITVALNNDKGFKWYKAQYQQRACSVKGYAFYDNEHLQGIELATKIIDEIRTEDPAQLLLNLNGNFALVYEDNKHVIATVDKVRSIPLFFSPPKFAGTAPFLISDDAYWIRNELDVTKINPLNMTMLMTTLYVLDNDTIFDEIKLIRAGEFLSIQKGPQNHIYRTERYYQLLHGLSESTTNEHLRHSYHKTIQNVFQRLIQSVNNRPMIVPLSGGLDSRLIVTMLKKLGAENVVCYTYGRKYSSETEISKLVSDTLGYPNHRVTYTRKQQRRDYHNPERKRSVKYAFNLCAHMNHHDIFAIWELNSKGLLPSNGIIIPGFFGEFIAGAHTPSVLRQTDLLNRDVITETIIDRHMGEWFWSKKKNPNFYKSIKEKISHQLQHFTIEDKKSAFMAFKWWEWQERQAKYIINACRVYEYLGFEWRLPFVDDEMLNFWGEVPISYQMGSRFYRQFLENELYKEYDLALFKAIKKKRNVGIYDIDNLFNPTIARSSVRGKNLVWKMYQRHLPGDIIHSYYLTHASTFNAYSLITEIDEHLMMD